VSASPKRALETEETESGLRPKWTPETEETGERFDKRTPETEETGERFNKRAPETEETESGERFDKRAPETEETESSVRPKRTPETEETGECSDKWAPETEETKLGVRSVGVRRSFAARHNGCDSQIYLFPVTICGVLVMLRNFFGRVA